MSPKYRAEVLRIYQEKKISNILSPNLIDPTPANLKAECLAAFHWYRKKDEEIIKLFYGSKSDENAYMQAIKIKTADKFKPLSNYLKGVTRDTLDRNIELLAFLINFDSRPYGYGWTASKQSPQEKILHALTKDPDNIIVAEDPLMVQDTLEKQTGTDRGTKFNKDPGEDFISSDRDKAALTATATEEKEVKKLNRFRFFKPVYLSIIVLLSSIVGVGFLLLPDKDKTDPPPGIIQKRNEGCMYWAENRYLAIPCGQQHGDTMVIRLDTMKMSLVKKISDWKNISHRDIGRVRYVKIDGKVEFYTSTSGKQYPADTIRPLRPMSEWIYNKYVPHY